MKIKNDLFRFISKSTALTLIAGCVLLSSPGIMLADVVPPEVDPLVVTETAPASPPLDVQPLQTSPIATDTTTITDLPPILDTTSSADQPIVQDQAVDPALATDPSSTNATTGADSVNTSTTDVTNTTDITNQNFVQAFNDSFLQADTGSNTANYNTGSGIITTSQAKGDGQLLNVVNKNSVQVGAGGVPSPDNATNSTTGANSANTSLTNINNELTVKNINDANIINRVTTNINSGNNDANFNTGHGIVTTGAANLGLNFFSLANTNLFGSQKFYANLQNIYNNFTGNVDLSGELAVGSSPLSGLLANAANNSTGANSSNQSIVNINDQTSITNQNTGKLNNEIDAKVTSGQNRANYNTGSGSVVSGQVNSSVNVVNFLNSNITSGNWMMKTLNVFGNWSGDLKLPTMQTPELTVTVPAAGAAADSANTNTGSASVNTTDLTINNSATLTNNNQATIENNVTMQTDSGNNDASFNGGAGLVKIGTANAETNEMNVANLNVTGNSWWLIVVNRFGTWNGTAVGSPEAVAIKTTGISTVLTPGQSGVDVTNNSTGPDSNNSAGVNIDHKTDITNTNQADIINTLNIQAVSGQNQTKYNSGHGYTETGAINGVNNIINFVNANITTANWVVVVVNVFGDWSGNLVFNTPSGGTNLPVGGSLSCPIPNSASPSITSANNATGSASLNNSNTATNNTNTATNNNIANLNNTTSAAATTGQNSANFNTGSGTVATGQADAGSSVANQANSNNVATAPPGGGGAIQSATDTTGAGSTNNSSATNTADTTATNNNNATADNNISGATNTGGNDANYNTGNGAIDTSWANTFLDLRNQVNSNQLTLGDLTATFNQTPVAPGSQAQVPNDNSSTQVCPGVTVDISPSTVTLANGAAQTFTAVANDSSGNPVSPQPEFTWTATGGTIDASGVYTAGSATGTFAVTATASYGNQGSANIIISAPVSPTGSGGGGGGGGNISVNSGGGGGGGGISLASAKKRIKGDFNNDGKVNDLDFSILMANWGLKRIGGLAESNGEGTVDDSDFSIVMANWTTLILALN
ncbi:MAG: hypothetical protein A2358_03410 [Candidatus Staskawiczbacteria bacterium RIFOXYB1_FULL_37_44]|uniref:BIG2 domain-containing protein n=1 Tax=Candidatus Staskawiczbacteria bacterium RIFOXYB1_FULL_37_44 TaxID=1802223 RepID=A0A1G2IU71_9BACT|nr:MAG: hypothetical protein A2358_03410 [Candidatus Staskawiczbacteria bacterium RIFOXYB1_FULL_37_44]OGZ83055.1 MAG: hypothetical protein A2416_01315 [Candidatus Staskawiczbacteria bacterium RIFOXYC1_FULL_37_52]OGZ90156.1 MAG: hypothetical protein A2581_01950 [Candidatus Staskawiczbacteria bacterium RIFOXYD1_FULL_37_110]